jgi:uncharacterized membrane protein
MSQQFLWILWGLVAVVSIIFGLALTHHWKQYDVEQGRHMIIHMVFYIGLIILLGISAIIIINYL